MNCEEIKSFLAGKFDRAELSEIPAEINEHLNRCRECSKYVNQLSQLDDEINQLSLTGAADQAIDRELENIKILSKTGRISRAKKRRFVLISASLILIAGATILKFFVGDEDNYLQTSTGIYLQSAQIDARPARTIIFKLVENNDRTIIWMY